MRPVPLPRPSRDACAADTPGHPEALAGRIEAIRPIAARFRFREIAVNAFVRGLLRATASLCVAFSMSVAASHADGLALARLVTWHAVEPLYPTYSSHRYTTYNIYIGAQQVHGGPMLFAALGDADSLIVSDLSQSPGACLGIGRDGSGAYRIELLPDEACAKPPCLVGADGKRNCHHYRPQPLGTGQSAWRRYRYSQALCEVMSLRK